MPWTCPRCSAANSEAERFCRECSARLPFAPPEEPPEAVSEGDETFQIPRRGELTAALREGLRAWRAGELPPGELIARLGRATIAVPQVFASLAEQLPPGEDEYARGVRQSLGDCQALLETGLGEMLAGLDGGDDFPVRFGWLLIEKGEEEYLRILESLRRDASGGAFAGMTDAVARVAAARERGELDQESMRQALDALESELDERLESSRREIRRGIEHARAFDGRDPAPVEAARRELRKAAQSLAEALLSVT